MKTKQKTNEETIDSVSSSPRNNMKCNKTNMDNLSLYSTISKNSNTSLHSESSSSNLSEVLPLNENDSLVEYDGLFFLTSPDNSSEIPLFNKNETYKSLSPHRSLNDETNSESLTEVSLCNENASGIIDKNETSPPVKKFKLSSSDELINQLISLKEKTQYLYRQMNGIEFRNAVAKLKHIHVRDIPLPTLSWTNSAEFSQFMCIKEKITLSGRKADLFNNPNLNIRTRAVLFDWLMEVCHVFKFRRVTYYLAIDYLDRYLSKIGEINKQNLQLVGVTCLFIAIKVEERYSTKPEIMASITDGTCTANEILQQEVEILTKLQWDLNPVTVIEWLCLYLQLATKTENTHTSVGKLNSEVNDIIYPQFSTLVFTKACILLDLCSFNQGMLKFMYSCIAASVVFFVLNLKTALFVSGYTWQDIKLCVEWMHPFASVVFRKIKLLSLVIPESNQRRGTGLRISNSSIVLNEGHLLQKKLINSDMLKEVDNEITITSYNFKDGKPSTITDWLISD